MKIPVSCNTSKRGCCGADAAFVCHELGIPHYFVDVTEPFEELIINQFRQSYSKGETPNPCVDCNTLLKFSILWDFIEETFGINYFATGHYARVLRQNNSAGLYEAASPAKDQSYVLAMIEKHVLANIILPMGDYSKEQTRQMAAGFGLGTEHQEESQEICFIPDDDYVAVLEQRCPELVRKGNIVDSSGKVLGEHNGVHRYTIGQRRGLRIAMGRPYYVTKIDAESNTVTLGPVE